MILWGFLNNNLNFSFSLTGKNLHTLAYFAAMAGNIIPAIATTNAVIAGLIVLEGLKILSGKIDQCRTVSGNKILLLSCYLFKSHI